MPPRKRPGPERMPRSGRTAKKPATNRVRSFAPFVHDDSEVLILGSMPGARSLAERRYYAHPQNAFWRIMSDVLGFAADASYEERLESLIESRIAVWDVLHSCNRTGSLDTSIDTATQTANDFARLFRRHPQIRRVLLNGTKAWVSYRRHVLAEDIATGIECIHLPSTSPANASWSYARKLAAWRAALKGKK